MFQSAHDAQQGGFAAARRADQDQRPHAVQGERDAVQDQRPSKRFTIWRRRRFIFSRPLSLPICRLAGRGCPKDGKGGLRKGFTKKALRLEFVAFLQTARSRGKLGGSR